MPLAVRHHSLEDMNRVQSQHIMHGSPPLLMSTRASAVSPANARQMCSSSLTILRTVRASCSFAVDFFSTPVSCESCHACRIAGL